jgi:hypothetical protein
LVHRGDLEVGVDDVDAEGTPLDQLVEELFLAIGARRRVG